MSQDLTLQVQETFIAKCKEAISKLNDTTQKLALVTFPKTGTTRSGPQYCGKTVAIQSLLRNLVNDTKLNFSVFGYTNRLTRQYAPPGVEYGTYNGVIPESIQTEYVIVILAGFETDEKLIRLFSEFSVKKCLFIGFDK